MDPSTDSRFLQTLYLRNILSYSASGDPIELRPLNVLIGPNGSGKSNLIEAISLLRATASDVRDVLSRGGGGSEWIWKGAQPQVAALDAVVSYPHGVRPLRHTFAFRSEKQTFRVEDEMVEYDQPLSGYDKPYFFYRYQKGYPVINSAGEQRGLKRESVEPDQSIIAQRRDPDAFPAITYLGQQYEKVRIYREWSFGRDSVFRQPQRADLRSDRLEEDFSNLWMFLGRLRRDIKTKSALNEALRDLYDGIEDYELVVEGGTVQVFFQEKLFSIPATRLSDGTMRYLTLLAILLDPSPPPLICIEEPELGLHPDLLPKLAELMVAASQRTQLIVTTHAVGLVDALTTSPEAILVCEKQAGISSLRRLNSERLSAWLEDYSLGKLWMSGELGGTRW